MFLHQGSARTHQHNLQIASLLSFVAGLVNVAGFLSVQKLTTNVTGHFAFFVDEVFKLDLVSGFVFFLYIFFFFLGSFVSNLLIEFLSLRNNRYVYVIPTIIEATILFLCAFSGPFIIVKQPDILAFSLLFAMGLQNSLVTTISNSAVRTTHLTGLFTDLGIELSQLFFYKQSDKKRQLYSSIKLRLTIISFFFLGGMTGGVFYTWMGISVLFIGGGTLLAGMIFDEMRLRKVRSGN